MIRTRIAPSPTGYLHIGTARTALYNYLFAKHNKGQFIVRIEDTDIERSQPEFEVDILEGLRWLGLLWDEGPDIGGSFAPYRQRERLDLYEKYLHILDEKGLIYHCFCTIEELEQERQVQVLSKQPPRYSGKCRDLTVAQRTDLMARGLSSVFRFKVDMSKNITVTDLIRGTLTFDTRTLDDFIIAKNFQNPLYNFVVVVDDHHMNITHVLRGEEHISNTPRQILLAEALGFSTPAFAHLTLILNPDKTKLSKRQNKVSLLEYKKEGYLPEALINFMALLGWNPGGEREIYSLAELSEVFLLEDINKSGAVFDIQKLDWFNAHYIRAQETKDLVRLCTPYLIDSGLIQGGDTDDFTIVETGERISSDYLASIIDLEKDRLKKLSEITDHTSYFFKNELHYPCESLSWKGMTQDEVRENLSFVATLIEGLSDFSKEAIEAQCKVAITHSGRKNGMVLWPFRVSLTGLTASPSPFEVAAILGKEKTRARIAHALAKLS